MVYRLTNIDDLNKLVGSNLKIISSNGMDTLEHVIVQLYKTKTHEHLYFT